MKICKLEQQHDSEQMFNPEVKKQSCAVLCDHFNVDMSVLDNPYLIARTGLVSKLLMVSELYRKVRTVPGDFVEFGVWMGQSLVLLENLRAVYEPFNIARTFYGFDTFDGYVEQTQLNIKQSEIDKYNVGEKGVKDIQDIFQAHCAMNNSRTPLELVVGDVLKTVPAFYKNYNGMIAFAYIDIATYETTNIILNNILPKVAKGGLVVIDDFGPAYPGVSEALKNNNIEGFKVEICPFYPTKIYLERL